MKNNLKRIAFYFVVILTVLSITPKKVYSSQIVFSDNFNTSLSKWEKTDPSNSSNWTIENGMATTSFIQIGSITQLVPKSTYWNNGLENFILEYDYMYSWGKDQNFLIQYKDESSFYELHFNDNMYLERTNPPFRSSHLNFTPNANSIHHVKIVYLKTQIKVYVDNVLQLDTVDSANPYSGYRIGLRAAFGNKIYFDNVVVSTVDGATPTPFPYLSQNDPKWKNLTYDTANRWSSVDPTIGKWGCAVTSATMVLQSYGITKLPDGSNMTPGKLNAWLKSEPNGYVGNGLVNWSKISKLTQIMHMTNPLWPVLDFRFGDASKATLASDLQTNQPSILAVNPGHFIVATKYTSDTDIDIADPAYDSRKKLSSYGNTFLSSRRFSPHPVDPRRITLYVLGDVSLSLSPKTTIAIASTSGVTITKEVLSGFPDGVRAGPVTTIADLPNPVDSDYSISISATGSGTYETTFLITDKDGNEHVQTEDILLNDNEARYEIAYQASGSATMQKRVDFTTLEKNILSLKSQGKFLSNYKGADILELIAHAKGLYASDKKLSHMIFGAIVDRFHSRQDLFESTGYRVFAEDLKRARVQLFLE